MLRSRFEADTAQYQVATLVAHPAFNSLHQEISRLRIGTCVYRKNDGSTLELDQDWIIPKGADIVMFSQYLALNAEAWARARPRSVAKPLEEFWAERFMTTSDFNNKKQQPLGDNAKPTADTLDMLNISFGGQSNSRPEQAFVRGIQTGTLAILLNEFELQLSDPEIAEFAIPPLQEVAYGSVKPLDKIRLRIRTRPVVKSSRT